MKKNYLLLFITLLSALYSFGSYADCIGGDAFKTCWDENGNTYDIQKFGNMTTMQGTNTETGTTWSQDSMTLGNTTYIDGTAGNGNSWNSTMMNIGGTTYIDGTDSKGNSFSSICSEYGCY